MDDIQQAAASCTASRTASETHMVRVQLPWMCMPPAPLQQGALVASMCVWSVSHTQHPLMHKTRDVCATWDAAMLAPAELIR